MCVKRDGVTNTSWFLLLTISYEIRYDNIIEMIIYDMIDINDMINVIYKTILKIIKNN